MLRILRLFAAGLALFASAQLGAQGPLDGYLKGKGVLDLAPSFSFNSARDFAGANGQTFDLGYKGNLLSLFAEYGLGNSLDVVATAAYVFTASQSGLQDGGLFLKYRPVYLETASGKTGVLLGSGLSFPLAGYPIAVSGALGQKAVVLPARVVLQWETPLGLFFNLTGGYNWRFDRLKEVDIREIQKTRPDYQPAQPANFTTFLLKTGFPAARYYLDAWVEWQHTRGGNDYTPGLPDLPQAFGVSYTQAGGTVFYSESGRNGFFLSGAWIFKGRNTSRILRITGGLVVKFGKIH